MISEDNKKFLKETFNIDCNKYTKDELLNIISRISKLIKLDIEKLEVHDKYLDKQIDTYEKFLKGEF